MNIADVEYEEFLDWMVALEKNLLSCQEALEESLKNVPVVEHLMSIFSTGSEYGVEEAMLIRNRDIINVLISLRQLEQGNLAPTSS
jgi:hypothetical protein